MSVTMNFNKEFPRECIEQAIAATRLKNASYLSRRLDLRSKTIFTLTESPEDIAETAFSLYQTERGWQLGVHVPDVSEYVCENSPLDKEAFRRLAAIETENGRIDMLPKQIIELCDLSSAGDKLALSILLDIDANGKLISVNFEESVIRVSGTLYYREVDQLGIARDTSSVMFLREKYAPFMKPLINLYELAAMFCSERKERNALDCNVFKRVYKREDGKAVSFSFKSESDSRAMIREIGYFVSFAIGEYMANRKLPCIYVGQGAVDSLFLDQLGKLVGENDKSDDAAERTAKIADKAKGTKLYEFVCDALKRKLPCAEFSVAPIFNTLCGCDKLVSFVHPISRYGDILTQRTLKNCVAASGNAVNINLNRYKRVVKEYAEKANTVAKFVYEAERAYLNRVSLEYIEYSGETVFYGVPLIDEESGVISVMLCCGAEAVVPSAYAANFEPVSPCAFEVIALGTEEELTIVKPITDR